MIFRPILAVAALALVAGACSSPPGSDDAKSACSAWATYQASWDHNAYPSRPEEGEKLSQAIFAAMNAAEAEPKYTNLSQDLQDVIWGTDSPASDAVDSDCASI